MLTVGTSLTVSGLLTLGTGTISGAGSIDANGGIAVNTADYNLTLEQITLNNASGQTATWNAGEQTAIELTDGAVINNDGTFMMQNSNPGGVFYYATINQGGGTGTMFHNDGTITAAPTTGTLMIDIPFDTAGGTINVESGTFELEGGGTSTGTTFTVASGATIEFAEHGRWMPKAPSKVRETFRLLAATRSR